MTKADQANFSDAELEHLAQKLDKEKPWRGLIYGLHYFFRRWMLTFWITYALYFYEFPAAIDWLIFLFVFIWEWKFLPKKAWDLNMSSLDILKLMKYRRLEKPIPKYAFAKIVALFSFSYALICWLYYFGFLNGALSGTLSLILLFFVINWTYHFAAKDYVNRYLEGNSEIGGPFTGNLPQKGSISAVVHKMIVSALYFLLLLCGIGTGLFGIYFFARLTFLPVNMDSSLFTLFSISFGPPILAIVPFAIASRQNWTIKITLIKQYLKGI